MSTLTQTSLELDTLDQDGSKLTTRVPPTALVPLASATPLEQGPDIASQDHDGIIEALPKGRTWIVITQLAGINFITSFTNGLIIVALPAISNDLDLDQSLLLWPSSAYALTSGSCLLIAGTVADVIGNRSVNLLGCLFIAIFILLSGFSQTGIQLIMFRAMQGIAGALALPSAMSIISRSIESGKPKNLGFASLGLAQPLGFSFGLVLGGLLVKTPGWKFGFYIGAAVSFLLFIIGMWALPKGIKSTAEASIWKRLAYEIDWLGACLASTSIALFSYVLAMLSADIANIQKSANIALLSLSFVLILSFIYWARRQENLGKTALIPNSLWKKVPFTAVCVMVLLSNAVINCMELFSSLFFQEVQDHSALGASLRILPNMVLGIITNIVTGWFVNKVPAIYTVLVASALCAVAPLLMAVIDPEWPYWYDAFFAQLLSPLSIDVLYTIGLLIVSGVFPTRTQALAGAVFNTLAQVGSSIGLTTTSVISVAVTKESRFRTKTSPEALMEGYRASFWTLFAWMSFSCVIGAFGLRTVGKVGEKRD